MLEGKQEGVWWFVGGTGFGSNNFDITKQKLQHKLEFLVEYRT